MDNNGAKGISIVLLFLLTLLFGWLPIGLSHRGYLTNTSTTSTPGSRRRKIVLDLLNCFAGGVFLGTCLLHLLAEGREEFETYKTRVGLTSDFPVYETTAGVGLFLIALVEKVGFAIMSFRRREKHGEDSQGAAPHHLHDNQPVTLQNEGYGYGTMSSCGDSSTGLRAPSAGTVSEFGPRRSRSQSSPEERKEDVPNCSDEQQPLTASLKLGRAGSVPVPRGHQPVDGSRSNVWLEASGEHHHHHHSLMASTSCQPEGVSQLSMMRALLLLLALSFHTVFDGLAVGLQRSATEVWGVLAAIAVHKSLVAFCLGLELVISSAGRLRRPLIFIFLFSLISPVGIGIGMVVTSGESDSLAQLLASSVLQALATGTFLYVTFFEILGQQFAHSHEEHGATGGTCFELVKVATTVVGFACMAGVKLLDHD